jgi:hypothetical protein
MKGVSVTRTFRSSQGPWACLLTLGFLLGSGRSSAGEAFLKGGFDLRPNDASGYDFLDGGIVSIGFGWPIADVVSIEAEAQSTYQSYFLGGHVQLRAIPVNGFVNLRLGFPRRGPYAGAGFGYLSEIVWGRVDRFPTTIGFSEYTKDVGVHYFGGAHLGRSAFVEYMGQVPLGVGNLYGTAWRHFALGGVRW